jgi:ParB/RepB/Spo0J family partition protein
MAKSSRQTLAQGAQSDFDDLFGARQGERIVSGGFKMLAHERITVRPQVRRTFAQAEMDELRASIRELHAQKGGIEGTGVLQALLVSMEGSQYRLIAGEKRFRATQAEGLTEIPCVIVPAVSEGMARLLQLTENALRSAPPVLEEAEAMRETMDQQKLSQRDLARLLGKNRGYIENRVRLLKMGPDLQEMIVQRPDTIKHAQLLAGVRDPDLRHQLIRAVVEEEVSVKELERRLTLTNFKTSAEPLPQAGISHEVPSCDGTLVSEDHNFQASLPSHDGREVMNNAPPDASKRDDPLATSLIPATSLLAQAQRQLTGLSFPPTYKGDLHVQIKKLEEHLAQIKDLVG